MIYLFEFRSGQTACFTLSFASVAGYCLFGKHAVRYCGVSLGFPERAESVRYWHWLLCMNQTVFYWNLFMCPLQKWTYHP